MASRTAPGSLSSVFGAILSSYTNSTWTDVVVPNTPGGVYLDSVLLSGGVTGGTAQLRIADAAGTALITFGTLTVVANTNYTLAQDIVLEQGNRLQVNLSAAGMAVLASGRA